METLSFVLGIAFVVVIAVAVVATYAFVKVLKTAKQIEDLERESYSIQREIYQSIGNDDVVLHRRIDELQKEVFSQLDSRLDRLENKLTTKK